MKDQWKVIDFVELKNVYFVRLIILDLVGFFWPHHVACGMLVPQPGIEPTPLAMKAQSLNLWTAGEFPRLVF